MDWIGVYVCGAPGVGKSLSTFYLSKFEVFCEYEECQICP